MTKKSEEFFSDDHFYIFVALGDLGDRPCFHIVPSKTVADYISTNHSEWLKGKKSDGSARKDSAMRNFDDSNDEFLEAWHLIKF